MDAHPDAFRFLTHEEFERLSPAERIVYLERAVKALETSRTGGPVLSEPEHGVAGD